MNPGVPGRFYIPHTKQYRRASATHVDSASFFKSERDKMVKKNSVVYYNYLTD
jgi:hypothetical protein